MDLITLLRDYQRGEDVTRGRRTRGDDDLTRQIFVFSLVTSFGKSQKGVNDFSV